MKEAANGSNRVVVVDDEPPWRIEVHLRETIEGSGAWTVTEVGIQSSEPHGTITASGLSRLPYRRVLSKAVDDARGTPSSGAPVLAFPSDPPPAFREQRRGRAPRTERDWAQLSAAWVDAQRMYDDRPGGELRLDVERTYEQGVPGVPMRWHNRYPDISIKTWRTNISAIKRRGLVHDSGRGWVLTEHARRILAGDLTTTTDTHDTDR